jgi:hypothetical protein
MNSRVEIVGDSGKTYSFTRLEDRLSVRRVAARPGRAGVVHKAQALTTGYPHPGITLAPQPRGTPPLFCSGFLVAGGGQALPGHIWKTTTAGSGSHCGLEIKRSVQ